MPDQVRTQRNGVREIWQECKFDQVNEIKMQYLPTNFDNQYVYVHYQSRIFKSCRKLRQNCAKHEPFLENTNSVFANTVKGVTTWELWKYARIENDAN